MGCLDTVNAMCPNCRATIKFQSKADKCLLAQYTSGQVPFLIAEDLNGAEKQCDNCGIKVILTCDEIPKYMHMSLGEPKEI